MAANKADVSFKLQGNPQYNRNTTVKLTSQATGAAVEARPFLDGSGIVRGLDPGLYEFQVTNANLMVPIETRIIRIFPQPQPTQVFVQVPEILFKNTPIADIPDANLGPVQQTASNVKVQVQAISVKQPGEAILAADWNAMAKAISDLAAAVGDLTQLVAPRGHNHPEIAAKIDEVQGNIRLFADAFGKTVLEIRRQFEIDALRAEIKDVHLLDIDADVNNRVNELQASVQKDTPSYTQLLSNFGAFLLKKIADIGASPIGGQAFLADVATQRVMARARAYAEGGVKTQPNHELGTYQLSTKGSLAARAAANA
jgi:hypothetical protein